MGDPIAEGDGFLMRQGYTMVWSGWQSDVALPAMLPPGTPKPELVVARFPTARQPDGSPVTGMVSTETIFDAPTGDTMVLPYPAASLDQPEARLTVQQRTGDPRRVLAATEWSFVDAKHVRIRRPEDMDVAQSTGSNTLRVIPSSWASALPRPVISLHGCAERTRATRWLQRHRRRRNRPPGPRRPTASSHRPSPSEDRSRAATSATSCGRGSTATPRTSASSTA